MVRFLATIGNLFCFKTSRQAPWRTWTPDRWTQRAVTPGIKRPECGTDDSSPLLVNVKNVCGNKSLPPVCLRGA